ncbi:hypothetical protein [Lyngbya sp. CCY1209]|uniref:hypothetical protein n=1 Tax=Lyngbya sp. CCY1209 TaxID=2886103 RepID=UPI002D206463|nr:hypothetical protein [Lyngbya sp. CCY1209]MEB3884042.1 hypothetical protein [Lyngbya sp. CCY1209]
MIILEPFDINQYNTEKVSWQISKNTYHIGPGYCPEFRILGRSVYLVEGQTLKEYREQLWKSMHSYHFQRFLWDKDCQNVMFIWQKISGRGLSEVAELALRDFNGDTIKVIYTGDREFAEMMIRAARWTASQMNVPS